jgi:carboxylesterase type B
MRRGLGMRVRGWSLLCLLIYSPRCPQPDEPNTTVDFGPYLPFEHNGQDDLNCLNLNVTCPKDATLPLPVFFWIHGGSLTWGAGSDPIWEPTVLVRRSIKAGTPIVVVTINYRLGPFGFLSPIDAEDDTVEQGNFGFHDQVNALEWCQRHIAGFGGDPRQVTIGGESAGGCSVHALIAYQEKLGEGRYFHRAVIQSGTFAVMGFWGRKRMDQIWNDALTALRVDKHADPLESMRQLHWHRLLYTKAFKVSAMRWWRDCKLTTARRVWGLL